MKNVIDFRIFVDARRKHKGMELDSVYEITEIWYFGAPGIETRFVTIERDLRHYDDDDNIILCVYNGYTDLLGVGEGEDLIVKFAEYDIPESCKDAVTKELMIQRLRS